MNRRNLAFLFAALAMVIAAALFHLTFNPSPDFDSGQSQPHGAAGNAGFAQVTAFRDDAEKTRGYVPPVVNPEDYTTAPKPHTVEGRLVKIWADRQLPDAEKAERFLTVFHELPADGKKAALDYATQLIPDDDYLRQRPRLLRMADTDELREVVMLDMLTRDDGIKMPSLVELMKTNSVTARAEAREILEAFLEKDYGDDPLQWDAPVRQWIAENQDI